MRRRTFMGCATAWMSSDPLALAGQALAIPANPFPLTVEHVLGETRIEVPPKRIVCLGLNDQDFAYALGIAPVGVTEWWGKRPYATWGWAEPERRKLQATPEVAGSRFFDYEWILSLKPDIILATYRDVDERSYRKLSSIAPVIAAPRGYRIWTAPWEVQLELIAQALGRSAEAQNLRADIAGRMENARSALGALSGQHAAIVDFREGQFVLWNSEAAATRFLQHLGFAFPPALDKLANSSGWIYLSIEQVRLLDIDLLMWPNDVREVVERLELFRSLKVYLERRCIWLQELDPLTSAALWFQSPLAIGYLLDHLPFTLRN